MLLSMLGQIDKQAGRQTDEDVSHDVDDDDDDNNTCIVLHST
jgi:hypothetical protein